MGCRADGFSNDAALLLDTCKGTMAGSTTHWACVLSMASPFGHGAIVSPDGSVFVGDGWFAGWMVQQ